MKNRFLHTVIIAGLTCALAAAQLTISGVTTDCVGGKRYHPAGVDIYAFDAAKSSQLVSLIKVLASSSEPDPSDSASVERFFARYGQLTRLVKSSKNLAHTKSDKAGNFKIVLSIPPTKLIVLAYGESADGPASYASAQVRFTGRQSSETVVLDFTHGHCTQ